MQPNRFKERESASLAGVAVQRPRRYCWTVELDSLLEQGYKAGVIARAQAIRRVCGLTGWPRQACWDRARKLGMSHKRTNCRRWSSQEENFLLQHVGSRCVRVMAKALHRTEKSVRGKLVTMRNGNRLVMSARVTDGHTKSELAHYLGKSPKTVQRWIDRGWLKARYEGKRRDDDALRITDEAFRSFWKKYPWEVPFHKLTRQGMEWFFSVMIDISPNETRGDPVARSERRNRQKDRAANDQSGAQESNDG